MMAPQGNYQTQELFHSLPAPTAQRRMVFLKGSQALKESRISSLEIVHGRRVDEEAP